MITCFPMQFLPSLLLLIPFSLPINFEENLGGVLKMHPLLRGSFLDVMVITDTTSLGFRDSHGHSKAHQMDRQGSHLAFNTSSTILGYLFDS